MHFLYYGHLPVVNLKKEAGIYFTYSVLVYVSQHFIGVTGIKL